MSSVPKFGAVILAAGASSRFGEPKPLAIFRGQSFLRHAIAAATSAGCDPVVVVLGHRASEIEAALSGVECEFTTNPEWREGMSTSIRSGLQCLVALDHDIEAALFLASDQPLVDANALRELILLHRAKEKPIVASAYSDTLGIPALFARTYFPALLELRGDRGAKDLLLSKPDDVASFSCPQAATDIDTKMDYDRLTEAG